LSCLQIWQRHKASTCHSQKYTLQNITRAGDFLSGDTMEASIPGHMPFTPGIPMLQQFTNSTYWIEQASKHLSVDHQEMRTGKETLLSTVNYQKFATRYNHRVNHIHSHNVFFCKISFCAKL
jgi:hypothetical protein